MIKKTWAALRQSAHLPEFSSFNVDALWNLAAIAVIGVMGIITNIVIASMYGVATLGVFNQVLAYYMILSQFVVCGVHMSALRHVSQYDDNPPLAARIILDSVLVAVYLSIGALVPAWLFSDMVGELLGNPSVERGLLLSSPAIGLFAINKILLMSINGLSAMRVHAVFNAGRFLLMLVFLLLLILLKTGGNDLAVVLVLTEVVLLLLQGGWLIWRFHGVGLAPERWVKRHLVFGLRVFPATLALIFNSWINVLLVGAFLDNAAAGIYSFASTLAEGVGQFTAAVRRSVSPLITRCAEQNDWDGLRLMLRHITRLFLPAMMAVSLLTWLLFPVIVNLLVRNPEFMGGWMVFGILLLGVAASSAATPFLFLYNQIGRPGANSVLLGLMVLVNVVANLLLIPLWGIYGSAVAVSLSLLFLDPFLRWQIKRLSER